MVAMIEVRKEKWKDIWRECLPLMEQHNEEVREENPDLPFEIDVEGSLNLENLGMLDCFTARDNDQLVGYLFWFITPALESKGTNVASMGPFYVDPSFSGAGALLWNRSLQWIRYNGVHVVYVHHSLFGPRVDLARRFFESRGAYPIETKYMLRI